MGLGSAPKTYAARVARSQAPFWTTGSKAILSNSLLAFKKNRLGRGYEHWCAGRAGWFHKHAKREGCSTRTVASSWKKKEKRTPLSSRRHSSLTLNWSDWPRLRRDREDGVAAAAHGVHARRRDSAVARAALQHRHHRVVADHLVLSDADQHHLPRRAAARRRTLGMAPPLRGGATSWLWRVAPPLDDRGRNGVLAWSWSLGALCSSTPQHTGKLQEGAGRAGIFQF